MYDVIVVFTGPSSLSIPAEALKFINTSLFWLLISIFLPPCLLWFPQFAFQASGFAGYQLAADHGCLFAGGFCVYCKVSGSFCMFAGIKLFFFHFFFLSFPFRISNSFLPVVPCFGYDRLFPDNYIYTASSPRVPGRYKFCNL